MTTKFKIKSGDTVQVIAGDHKGTEGKVVKILKDKNKAIVEGVNMVKKHTKPSAQNPQGGIVEKEAPIHISNLSLLTKKGETTRVGYRIEGDKKVRFSKKSNEVI
ncbi:50S ribosomal protein L24 [Gelidibacter japonicus]|uniref:50S ribosomal protein L24 n=1 Tax=Gelidibacter japonicus TaxID=1962232 RepID=UPI002021F2E4|nr:50S ribosomal protein L24 [Gelidibacter japonicus]MCL8008434.1 50S ribosomal protein L24 [Gelidibacter japonicus]